VSVKGRIENVCCSADISTAFHCIHRHIEGWSRRRSGSAWTSHGVLRTEDISNAFLTTARATNPSCLFARYTLFSPWSSYILPAVACGTPGEMTRRPPPGCVPKTV